MFPGQLRAPFVAGVSGPRRSACVLRSHWRRLTSSQAGDRAAWWAATGSNRRPLACQASALPSELAARDAAPILPVGLTPISAHGPVHWAELFDHRPLLSGVAPRLILSR